MSQFRTANVNSVVDLRNATDEKLPIVLTTLGYKQSFTLVDTRLAIGYLSVAAAGLTFLVERKLKFEEGFNYTLLLVVVYAVLSSVAWIHSKFVEKDVIYQGSKGGQSLQISGTIDKYVPSYPLTLKINNKGQTPVQVQTVLDFTSIFDKYGNLHEGELAIWIKKELESHTKEK